MFLNSKFMNKSKIIKVFGSLVIAVGLVFAGWLVGTGEVINLNPTTTPSVAEQVVPKTVSIMFDFGDGTVKTFSEISLPKESSTVFDILSVLSAEKKIDLAYKDYSGDLGVFIQSINSVPSEGNTDKWWQFWVNNNYSLVGVSGYNVNSGDVIEFKFTKGQ